MDAKFKKRATEILAAKFRMEFEHAFNSEICVRAADIALDTVELVEQCMKEKLIR